MKKQKQRIFAAIIVFCLLFSVIPVFQVSSADPDYYWLNVQVLSRKVLFKGESASIRVDSNESQVQLSIYDSADKLVYSNKVSANTTTVFPVPATYGLFTVKASVIGNTATTWFWLQNTEKLESFTLPYKWSWKGLDYVLTADYELQATSKDGQTFSVEWLSEIFTKLKPTVTLLRNNDLLYVGTYGKDISADSWIMNTYFGVKIRVNGTLAKSTTLKWNYKAVEGDILWNSQTLRMGNLVYDYSDFDRSTGLSYSVDKTGLKSDVVLSTAFDVDPTIFESGFETGDFSEWTGTEGATAPAINSTVVHHGTYSAKFDSATNIAAYKDLVSSAANLNVRAYVYIESWVSTRRNLLKVYNGSGVSYGIAEAGVDDAGSGKWKMYYRNASAWSYVLSSGNFSLDTWHCVELEVTVNAGSGTTKMYVDNVEVCSATGIDNSDRGNITGGAIGGTYKAPVAFFDCVVFSDSYIGLESSDTTAPTYSALSSSTTISGASCQFNATFTDETALESNGQYEFGINSTGAWVWESAINFTSTPETISVSKALPNTVGSVVGYRWNFTDNAGNSNTTGVQTLTVTADTYTVTLSGLTSVGVGETVLIGIAVSRAAGVAVSSWQLNITNNGDLWKENYAESSFSFTETYPTGHKFNVTGLYDVDCGASVTPTCSELHVIWQATGPGSTGGNNNPDANSTVLFSISDVNLGTVSANSTVQASIEVTFNDNSITITEADFSSPFDSWLTRINGTGFMMGGSGEIQCFFSVPSVQGTFGGKVTVSALDGFGRTHSATAKVSCQVGEGSGFDIVGWIKENLVLVVLALMVSFVALGLVAVFVKRSG